MKSLFKRKKGVAASGKTIVEYLPDADEIERSPAPPYARVTLHVLVLAMVVFVVWAMPCRMPFNE